MHKIRKIAFLLCAVIIITSTESYIFTGHPNVQAQAVNYRQRWLTRIQEWSNIMESDASTGKPWRYKSGSGEITNYKTNRSTQRYSNCALFVTHALQYMGVLSTSQKFYAKASDGVIKTVYSGSGTKAAIQKYCDIISIAGKYTTTQLIQNGKLQKGDIVCFYGMQHTVVYNGLDKSGRSVWYDAGRGGTSTGKSGGIWNKTYSLVRVRYTDSMTSSSWKVNDIIRFREPKTTTSSSSTASSTGSTSTATKSTNTESAAKSSTSAGSAATNTQPVVHKIKTPSKNTGIIFSGVSYKIKNKKLYLRFTVKNNIKYTRKIYIRYLLGKEAGSGTGRSTKTITLPPGKKKSCKWIKVSTLKVTKSRCYLTILATSGKTKIKISTKVIS